MTNQNIDPSQQPKSTSFQSGNEVPDGGQSPDFRLPTGPPDANAVTSSDASDVDALRRTNINAPVDNESTSTDRLQALEDRVTAIEKLFSTELGRTQLPTAPERE